MKTQEGRVGRLCRADNDSATMRRYTNTSSAAINNAARAMLLLIEHSPYLISW